MVNIYLSKIKFWLKRIFLDEFFFSVKSNIVWLKSAN